MESAAQDLAVAAQLGLGAGFSWDTFRKGIIAGFVIAVVLSILVVVIVVRSH
jgi:hypothetical protein